MGQKISVLGPKRQTVRKIDQRKIEEVKSTDESEIAIEKVQSHVQKELKQLSDANLKREQQHQELITKLQEQVKESSSLVNDLRSDLDDARKKMAIFDDRVQQLETQVSQEQQESAAIKKRAAELEVEIKSVRKQVETEIDLQRVRKDLENEKAAREEAVAKILALELEMNAAMKELDSEKRRLKFATDKINLVETHLREFYSTTEELRNLFGKQQDQLKEMQKTLVDDDEEIHRNKTEETEASDSGKNEIESRHEGEEAKTQEAVLDDHDRVVKSDNEDVVEEKEVEPPVLVYQMTGI